MAAAKSVRHCSFFHMHGPYVQGTHRCAISGQSEPALSSVESTLKSHCVLVSDQSVVAAIENVKP